MSNFYHENSTKQQLKAEDAYEVKKATTIVATFLF